MRLLAAILGLFVLCPTAPAHHAFSAQFDAAKPVKLSGKVSKVVWLNPHARFLMTVTPSKGAPVTWEIVLGSPNVLMRQGWTRYTIKEGDSIDTSGYAARDGSRLAVARAVRLGSNRTLIFGSDGDGGPER